MSVDLIVTHRIAYHAGGLERVDGVARAPGGARHFVPGFLPCGECPLCRRGLVGACPVAARPLASASQGQLQLPPRFLTAIDEPPEAAPLSDPAALLAGIVAFALHAVAVASLAPGDTAIWLGGGPVSLAGAALCRARDAQVFAPNAGAGHALSASAHAELRADLAALAAAAPTTHGSRKRLVFLTEPGAAIWADAAALGEPGTTYVALDGTDTGLPAMALPAEARLVMLSAAHPDFVPEGLAALRRAELEPLRAMATADAPPFVITEITG